MMFFTVPEIATVSLEAILLVTFAYSEPSLLNYVPSHWSKGHDFQSPAGICAIRQKFWDHLRALGLANHLVEDAMDNIDRAHLLASTPNESGPWLQSLPIAASGLWLDDDIVRIVVVLCLGTLLCAPINVCIVGRRLMLWVNMGLAVGGLRRDIRGKLPSMTSFIVPCHLQVCQQDLSHQGYSAVMASDQMVFWWYCGVTDWPN